MSVCVLDGTCNQDGERRDSIEERERKKDKRRQALARKADLPQMLVKINKMNNPDEIRRRAALVLPAPQVSGRWGGFFCFDHCHFLRGSAVLASRCH